MTKIRIRQHVNPLARKFQQKLIIPQWQTIYANLDQPLLLDLGCARGEFILAMAQQQPHLNFLGVEIREALVRENNREREVLNLTNLYYFYGNINVCLGELLQSLPLTQLQWVLIQFPDPWFKKKHHKRRLVTPELVDTLATYLQPQTQVFIQSDVAIVAQEICDRFNQNPHFQKTHTTPWLEENIFSIATAREKATLNKNQPVYRALFAKI